MSAPDWRVASVAEANPLLAAHHYLGPMRSAQLVFVAEVSGEIAGAMVWRKPTARGLPSGGAWLELSRWCLTPALGDNAGSRCHRQVVRLLRDLPHVTTLVSYSDPSVGHTGALYRSCNWQWAPTWHRLRPPPTGNGSWDSGRTVQSVKDRWVFPVRPDPERDRVLQVRDPGAVRRYLATTDDLRPALRSAASDLRAAAQRVHYERKAQA